jgi:arylsulfatase A-like enzyme
VAVDDKGLGPLGVRRPNVLLVVFDTARLDAFTPYNAGEGVTPTVLDLAGRGTAFPRAFATSNWTLPSHASMFTGLLPSAVGFGSDRAPVFNRADTRPGPLRASRPALETVEHRLLAAVLARAGYATRGVSANPWVSSSSGLATGFESFTSVIDFSWRHTFDRARDRWKLLVELIRARRDAGIRRAEWVVRRWLRASDGQPWFWFVNLMECHAPYAPPRPYNDLGVLARVQTARDIARYQSPAGTFRICTGALPVPPAAWRRMRHLYLQSIRLMDDWLGRVLEMLDRHRVLDDTLVVVTSDRLIRVPLVVAGPDRVEPEPLVSLADLPRILADAVGLHGHPWDDEVRPHGAAVAQVDGQPLRTREEEFARAFGVTTAELREHAVDRSCATDGNLKLVRTGSREEVFDLRTDPLESAPLDPVTFASDSAVRSLRAAIDDAAALRAPIPSAAESAMEDGEETEMLEEQLRALGYM